MFVINVAYGVSRVAKNGTSLSNYANVEAILGTVEQLLVEDDIEPRLIKILAYYQAQRRLLGEKIKASSWPEEWKEGLEISTVDAFKGREAEIILLDMVVAYDQLVKETPIKSDVDVDDEDDAQSNEEDEEPTISNKYHIVGGFVREPKRLCVGLTRGKSAVIIFCQEATLTFSLKERRGKKANAVSNMIVNARLRKLIYRDTSHEDTHPARILARKSMTEKVVSTRRKEAKQKEDVALKFA